MTDAGQSDEAAPGAPPSQVSDADAGTAEDKEAVRAATSNVAAEILDSPEGSLATAERRIETSTSDERIAVAGAVQAEAAAALAEAAAVEARQANRLRSIYGYVLLGFVLLQILAADVIFLLYASSEKVRWDIPASTLNVWLGATVVQVIGVVIVVVHYLFPNRDQGGPAPAAKA